MIAKVEKSSVRFREYPRHIHIMIELKEKNLDDNDISDITPRAGLTKLEEVDLGGNNLADASPLVGLTSLTYVNLEDDPLNQASIETHIPAIEANGARGDFDLPPLPVDLKQDGVVDVHDLVFVASRFGHACPTRADRTQRRRGDWNIGRHHGSAGIRNYERRVNFGNHDCE